MLFTPDQLLYEGAKIIPLEDLIIALSQEFLETAQASTRIQTRIGIGFCSETNRIMYDSIIFHKRAIIRAFEDLGWYEVAIYEDAKRDTIQVILEK